MSVQRYLPSGKMHLAYSSTNISQVLLNVESTLEIKIVLMIKIGSLTTQEHRWRKSKRIPEKMICNFIVAPLIYAKQKCLLATGDANRRSSFVSIGCKAFKSFQHF